MNESRLTPKEDQVVARPYWADAFIHRFEEGSIRELRQKTFTALSASLAELHCTGPLSQDIRVECGRLCVTLAERGGRMQGRIDPRRPTPMRFDTMHQMTLTPGGSPLWVHSDTTQYLAFGVFHFDHATVVPLIGEDVDVRPLAVPRLQFYDERVMMIVRLLAMECHDATQTDLLYADSLSLALLLRLCKLDTTHQATQRQALSPRRLRLARDYMLADLSTPVRLEDVAGLLGISPAHFSRAFKRSTGLSPHQWRLHERLEHARRVMATTSQTVAETAIATGFVDQAHFTRVFKRIYGVTPAAWKKSAM